MKNEIEKIIERWAHINKVPGTTWWNRRKWRKQALLDLSFLIRFIQTHKGVAELWVK